MLIFPLKFSKMVELLSSCRAIANTFPENIGWQLAKNIRILKDSTEEIQEMISKQREEYVDKEEDGKTPVQYDDVDPRTKQPIKVSQVNDPVKKKAFDAIVEQVNKDHFEIKLHRILLSEIEPDLKTKKINQEDIGNLLGYVFVESEDEKKKSGEATKDDIYKITGIPEMKKTEEKKGSPLTIVKKEKIEK